ncbi:hypothetical protein ES703_48995 [subsurface metagenome]
MWTSVLLSGVEALLEYLSFHVLTCLVPAFFIAGAISSMVRKEVILDQVLIKLCPMLLPPWQGQYLLFVAALYCLFFLEYTLWEQE